MSIHNIRMKKGDRGNAAQMESFPFVEKRHSFRISQNYIDK